MPVLLWSKLKGMFLSYCGFRLLQKRRDILPLVPSHILLYSPLFCLLSPRKPMLLSCPNYTKLYFAMMHCLAT